MQPKTKNPSSESCSATQHLLKPLHNTGTMKHKSPSSPHIPISPGNRKRHIIARVRPHCYPYRARLPIRVIRSPRSPPLNAKVIMDDVQHSPPHVPGSAAAARSDADAVPPVFTPSRGKKRPGVPSLLSNDDYKLRHEIDTMRCRSINSPLMSPLRLWTATSPPAAAHRSSLPSSSHLPFNQPDDTIINNSGSGTPLAMGNAAPTVHWGTTDVDDYIPAATITSPANAEHPPAYQFEGVNPEDDPTGAYTDEYSTIPDHTRHLINKVCLEDWGVSLP